MAVVTCPKCPTALRIPDGVSGNVKCPKCSTLFPVARAATITAKPAPKPPPKSTLANQPPPKPAQAPITAKQAPQAANNDIDFEVIDDPKPAKRRIEDDEEERKHGNKKKKWYDDEEEEELRPRKKKKSQRSDDDEDWLEKPSRAKEGHGPARVGLMLLTISSWLYCALYGLLTLGVFILLVSILGVDDTLGAKQKTTSGSSKDSTFVVDVIDLLMLLIGLIGLANWLVSIVGFSFCIAGPERSRPMSIIAASVSGVHLIFVILTYLIAAKYVSELGTYGGPTKGSWLIFATTIPFLDFFLPTLIYSSRSINGEFIVLILTGICEVVRIFFTMLTIRTFANVGKDHKTAERAQIGIVGTAIVVGAGIFIMFLVLVLIKEVQFKSLKTALTLGVGSFFMHCLAYTVLLLVPAILTIFARSSLAGRNR